MAIAHNRAKKAAHMTAMRYRARFTVPALAVLSFLLQAKVCRADDSELPDNVHRLSLVAGYIPLSYIGSRYQDNQPTRDKEPATLLRAGYAYRAYPALEVGAALSTAITPYSTLLMPQGTVRGFLTFTERPRLDAGLSARIGMLSAPVGLALSAGLDVRIWPTRYCAVFFGSSVGAGGGSSTNPSHEVGYFSLGSIELGLTFAL
jgi:hypothetical protein